MARELCPECGSSPFDQMLPRQFYSWWRRLFRRPMWAVICRDCRRVVGYEK